jgi:hypothetical protein
MVVAQIHDQLVLTLTMKNFLRIEEAMQLVLAIYLYNQLPYDGWLYAALFLTPDISMAAYLFGTNVGALFYNLFHHKGVAIGIYLIGIYVTSHLVMLAGLLLFGHTAFDRILGYGLKYPDNFKHTHLGWINKK